MMGVKEILLEPGEYYAEVFEKDTVFIHHTAGGHRPDWVVQGAWENDKSKAGLKLAVATAYVIGGVSTTDKDSSWDGVIVKAFDDKFWAHHLGTTEPNNRMLNAKSIGIEICNYGGITMGKDGIFYNYVHKPVPADQVIDLKVPFRGYRYYHSYTKKQLSSLRELLLHLAHNHSKINLKRGLQENLVNDGAFEVNRSALKGSGGLWSHTNVRGDKNDCYPHPQLIELIKTL
jgi:hypothetical protein